MAIIDADSDVLTPVYPPQRTPDAGITDAIRASLTQAWTPGAIGHWVGDVSSPKPGHGSSTRWCAGAATMKLYPRANTIIEIGGDDSKLITLKAPDAEGKREIADFAMNTLCAAGTGSFLDKQASRLSLSIEQFGELGAQVDDPPRVAGRCSVFAKSDMIHLQQLDADAGHRGRRMRWCNFRSTVAAATELQAPTLPGRGSQCRHRRRCRKVLGLGEDELIVPEHLLRAPSARLNAVETGEIRCRAGQTRRACCLRGCFRRFRWSRCRLESNWIRDGRPQPASAEDTCVPGH